MSLHMYEHFRYDFSYVMDVEVKATIAVHSSEKVKL